MDEIKKMNVDNLHKSSSVKNFKGNNIKKNKTNINIINEFKKINTIGTTNTSGTQPIIIYKKELNNHNIKRIKNNNIYINDGGIKKKLERYNNGHSYSIPKKKTLSCNKKKKSKNYYPTKKKLFKSSTQEKLFSQTMIDSFKRPNIPKKEKNKIINKNQTINYSNEKKSKENKKFPKPLKNKKNLSQSCIINLESKKIERMNKLVKNAVEYEMRKNQIETEKKPISLKDKISFRKKGYLENNGIKTTWTIDEIQEYDINDRETENKNENEKNNEGKKEFKLKKKPKTEINSNSHTIHIGSSNYFNNNLINNNEENNQLTLDVTKKNKRVLKPKVNQFEFLQKIQEEQKKLPFHIEISNNNKRQINKNLSTSIKINDSFRHKSNINNNKSDLFEIGKKYSTIQFPNKETENNNSDEFPFAKKRNNRKNEELVEFIRRKKIKQRKEEENKEYEKKKKLFEIFKNLSNLKDSYNNYTSINNNSSIFKKRNRKNILKYKEINEYYIGTDSSRNGSTILDLNEYYLNILESQQLLVNSGLNKINDLSFSLENNNLSNRDLNNKNDNNNIENNNEEELKHINNILNINKNKDIQNINEDELNTKINNTIRRVSDIISQRNNNSKEKTENLDKKNEKLKDINLENINNNNNTNSDANTKEKNLPSLPHSFSNNSNPNKKVDIEIQPYVILNLVEIIRLIFQRKVFFRLYQIYINYSYSQRYIIAFSFFVAICKQFPFKAIEGYCNYKTYYYAFRQLLRPFIRKNFKRFLNNCISITKIGYFVELLSRMFKFKTLELIYIYSQLKNEEENIQLKSMYSFTINKIKSFIQSILKEYFKDFCQRIKSNNKLKEKEKQKGKPNLNIDIDSLDIIQFYSKKKNKSTRINSFIYESFDSKSYYSIHPNSVDNDILHQFQNYLIEKNKLNIKNNKILKDNFLENQNSNKSQDNYNYHKRNNNKVKINFNFSHKNNNKAIEDSENVKKKENEISLVKKNCDNNLENNIKIDNKEKENIGEKDNEQKIKIEKIKIVNNENQELNKNNKEQIKTIDNKENKNDIKEKNNSSEKIIESDISADKDISHNIIWEYNLSSPKVNNEGNESDYLNKEVNVEEKKKEKEEKEKEEKEKEEKERKEKEEKERKEKEEKERKENEEKERKEKEEKERKEKEEKERKEKEEKEKKEKEEKEKEEKEKEKKEKEKKEKEEKEKKEKEEKEKNEKEEKEKKGKEENDFDLDDIILSSLEEDNKNVLDKEEDKEKNKNAFGGIENNKTVLIKDIIIYNEEKDKKDNKLYEDLTEEIIKKIIESEVKRKDSNLLPIKSYKYDKFENIFTNNCINNSSGNFKDNNNSLKDNSIGTQNSFSFRDNNFPNIYLNESILSSISASSYFNKTIKDKKKEKTLFLYLRKIAPLLIKLIQEEIFIKYDKLYENISIPLKNNYEGIMVALELQNGEMIRDNYKRSYFKEEIKDIIDKNKILKKIEPINKEIRNNDNIFDDNYYDRNMNECIIDTAIEIIKNERMYGEDGEPLPWGGRTRELIFKYEKNNPKKLVDYVTEKLIDIINTKIGLINNNYEYLTQEQLNSEKEKRLIKTLKEELKEQESHWNNLEIEETQLKIEITEIINEQLYNEVMEILEHISLSRKKPELYQSKSIFVCEEIPKLSFQQNTTENKGIGYNGEENDLINIE